MKHFLVVEDNADIANLVAMHLRDLDAHVDIASKGNQGLSLAQKKCYDLIVLDLMLPELDGLEICKHLRSHAHTQSHMSPILMLTARGSELNRIVGLEMGADDYLTKPFSVLELIARVKAILRRVNTADANSPVSDKMITAGSLSLDKGRRHATIEGNNIDLTAREFDLLWHFARHPGQVFTRTQLLDSVWGYGHDGYEHTVNSHINRLRAKIEQQPSTPEYILTVWGVGYKFNDTLASTQD